MRDYFKKILNKNGKIYLRIKLIQKITFKMYFLNFIFQKIFRVNSGFQTNLNFTSTCINPKGIKFNRDLNTLASFSLSGHCYFQALNGIVLGENFLFAPGVKLISANHDLKYPFASVLCNPIVIGNNCWIGANVVVLPGVQIGDNCVIGAGSVVTKSFDSNLVIAGNPAKIIKVNE